VVGRARFLIVSGPNRGAAGEPARFAWRLLSANNRELGRSPVFFPQREACEQAVSWLHANIERAVPVVVAVRPGAQWGWRLDIDEQEVALSARAYHRLRECRYNLAHFLAGVLAAEVEPAARALHGGDCREHEGVTVR
jgi:hypothetical protein